MKGWVFAQVPILQKFSLDFNFGWFDFEDCLIFLAFGEVLSGNFKVFPKVEHSLTILWSA